MEANLRDDFLSLINMSLAHVYCSTTLSNHKLIRLKRFVSQISRKLCNYVAEPPKESGPRASIDV